MYQERKKEECVDWEYTKTNEQKENTLTIYYANESWTMWQNDVNDLCAFVKEYPSELYDYSLEGREDFAERRHRPTEWGTHNPELGERYIFFCQTEACMTSSWDRYL